MILLFHGATDIILTKIPSKVVFLLTKGFLVKIVPEVPLILKQLSTSPSGVKEVISSKQTHSLVLIRLASKLHH